MVVDILKKFVHLFVVTYSFSAAHVADIFFKEISILHGLSKSIVSDRDGRFMSDFWQEIFKLVGINLTPSTIYHPQTDGQTKSVN